MSGLDFRLEKNVLHLLETPTKDLDSFPFTSQIKSDLFDKRTQQDLEDGEFSRVLKTLWSEKDLKKKLFWLEQKSIESHPLLLFEEAIAKFQDTPTLTVLVQETIPLVHGAHFRLLQDAACSLNPVVPKYIVDRILEVYRVRLGQLVYKKLKKPLFIIENEAQIQELNLLKVKQIAENSLSRALPSPVWIGFCGMNCFSVGKPNMIRSTDFTPVRHSYALQELAKKGIVQLSRPKPKVVTALLEELLAKITSLI